MRADVVDERVIEIDRDKPAPGARPASEEPLPRAGRRISRKVVVSGLAVAAAIAGVLWISAAPSSESTDDAYVAADTTQVAPKVRGLISELLVRENQTVRQGDPLVRIDPEEFDAKAASALADLADARSQVADARAALASLEAERGLAAANVDASRTSIRAAAAEADRAAADERRFDRLVSSGAVAQRDADSYRTTAIGAAQTAARARAELTVAQRQSQVTDARRAILEAALAKALARRQGAEAALTLARQDQRHTLIRAPINGVVGNRSAQVGDYVQPGSRLLALVPLHDLYVTANFKETQTRHMRAGQAVSIEVDALHGAQLEGRVESFAPGSGSTFALLPFEPGTGNFTKIVQRVPVRIRLERGQAGLETLRPGLSVTARVRLSP
ncbi:MAG: HlyD family secretion protein [Pseudomonadota bacterium]